MCKLKDEPGEPDSTAFWEEQLKQSGNTLRSYWADMSYGAVETNMSVVSGWHQLDVTQATAQSWPAARTSIANTCINKAISDGVVAAEPSRYIIVTNVDVNSGATGNRVVTGAGLGPMSFIQHEMGHVYGLGHSFSADLTYQNSGGSKPGEYGDRRDVMSCLDCARTGDASSVFGLGGPGLSGEHRAQKGWMPMDRTVTFGEDGTTFGYTWLRAVNTGATLTGTRLIRIPFDESNPHRYLTVEYLMKSGWSAGIPTSSVLIREVETNGTVYIQTKSTRGHEDFLAGDSFTKHDISIDVLGLYGDWAQIRIKSSFAKSCLPGWVKRRATDMDEACVHYTVRDATMVENWLAPYRVVSGWTCKAGYVWRQTSGTDRVCVYPTSRDRAAVDNAAQAGRVHNPAAKVHNPLRCKPGLVWRTADSSDYVCVLPTRKALASFDNAYHPYRVAEGGFYCKPGYVWRSAWPTDYVCVSPSTRDTSRQENEDAQSNMAKQVGDTVFIV